TPEYAAQFEENFRSRAGMVDKMAGFISNQVLRPIADAEPYIVLTMWRSRADFNAWVESDAVKKGHTLSSSLPKEAFSRPSHVELHEVIQDSTRPDLEREPEGAHDTDG